MPIQVFEACRFEPLWDRFLRSLERPREAPLDEDLILVPAAGWESFFVRELTGRYGCFARYRFLTLGSWLNQTLGSQVGTPPHAARDVDAMTWAIAGLLPQLRGEGEFQAVHDYLRGDGGEPADETRRLLDLSRNIARLFDQYLIFRPELIDAWNQGRDWPEPASRPPQHAAWQRRLWQRLGERMPLGSVRAEVVQLSERLARGDCRLPKRVLVWMCGGVPPVHLEFLEAASRKVHFDLFALTPRPQDGPSPAGPPGELREFPGSPLSLREFCESQGLPMPPPLLESLGRLSLDRWLAMHARPTEVWNWNYPEPETLPPTGTLLGDLRQALETGTGLAAGGSRADASLRIHSCHSPLREVEVLRDQLRAAFENDPTLRPEDVLIMCPDLDTYAPLVEAVFATATGNSGAPIPVSIAGRSPRKTRPVVEAWFRILDVLGGRLPISEVLDLLNIEPVASAARLSVDEVATIGQWLTESRVRWGADADHREAESLPRSDLNTWQFGLDRLILGFAMPPGGGQLVGSTVALDRASGLEGEVLGKFWRFFERLRAWRARLADALPLAGWREPLGRLADELLDASLDEAGVQRLRDAMDQIARHAEHAGFQRPVKFPLVVRELALQVDQMAAGSAFRLGGVTVCDLAARRSLPSKVVCLLGLNDGDFPRADRPLGFDLMAEEDRAGDRSLRLEDKHLMLEALLSARHQLIITYQGQNVQDQRSRPPSVVVEELLDTLRQAVTPADAPHEGPPETDDDPLIVQHPLQAFSPRYFDGQDQRLFSYERDQLRAARGLQGERVEPPVFAPAALPNPEQPDPGQPDPGQPDPRQASPEQPSPEQPNPISQRELQRSLERPWEVFLGRLGIWLTGAEEPGSDREPLVLDSLEAWQVGETWLQEVLADQPLDVLAERLRRGGQLPAGALGRLRIEEASRRAGPIIDKALEAGVHGNRDVTPLEWRSGLVHVTARIGGLTPQGIRRATFSEVGWKQAPRLWLDHLLVAAALGVQAPSILVGRGKPATATLQLAAVDPQQAVAWLEDILALHRMSLQVPLPFFRESVVAVMKKMAGVEIDFQNESETQPLLFAAQDAYQTQFIGTAPAELPSVRVAFAGRDPFQMQCDDVPELRSQPGRNLFLHLVQTICVPLVKHVVSD